MDIKLQRDLDRFFRVYKNNTSEILNQMLPMEVANAVEAKLNDEFDDFTTSLKNRLAEEFRK